MRKKRSTEEEIQIRVKNKPKRLFIPKFYASLGDPMEPGQEQRELIEDIFEELRLRLMELESQIQGDSQFYDAIEIIRDLVAETEEYFLEEYELPED